MKHLIIGTKSLRFWTEIEMFYDCVPSYSVLLTSE